MEGLIKVLPGKVVVYTCYVTRGLSFETGGGWKKIVKIIDGTGKKNKCVFTAHLLCIRAVTLVKMSTSSFQVVGRWIVNAVLNRLQRCCSWVLKDLIPGLARVRNISNFCGSSPVELGGARNFTGRVESFQNSLVGSGQTDPKPTRTARSYP